MNPSFDKIAAYRRQISSFGLSITGVMVGGWSLSQLPLGWRWSTPCTSAAGDKPVSQNLVHFFFYQGFSSNLKLHSQSQSAINLYEDSMSVAAFSQIPFSAICKTNLINLILMIVIIIVIIVVVVVASLCVSWQRCLSRRSGLSPEYRNSWSNPFELWHKSSSCVHANCFAALPAACWGKKKVWLSHMFS